MDLKKYLPLIVVLAAGCTTTARMTRQEIDNMGFDCEHKQQQIAFLQKQMISGDEYIVSGMMVSSVLGYVATNADGTYQQRRDFLDGYNSGIRLKIDQIRNVCHAYPPR